jgi:predicted RND superfamily exporter protein
MMLQAQQAQNLQQLQAQQQGLSLYTQQELQAATGGYYANRLSQNIFGSQSTHANVVHSEEPVDPDYVEAMAELEAYLAEGRTP